MGLVLVFIALVGVLVYLLFRWRPQWRKGGRWHYPSTGEVGEWRVTQLLEKHLPQGYCVLNDIILPSAMGTTQIDHIVFSVYGIFVIETKNYQGKIYGGEESYYWQQIIGENKYQFRNPIKQNYAHIRALQDVLMIKKHFFHSIITFSDEAEVRAKCAGVTNNYNLIRAITEKTEALISPENAQELLERVQAAALANSEAQEIHLNNVQAHKQQKESKINDGICPQCGGTLIERQGKYGNFRGCSNYPNCKFTIN